MYKRTFLLSIIMLSFLGIIMIYSASSIWSLYKIGNDKYYLYRQLLFTLFGWISFFIISKISYKKIIKYAKYIFIIAILLLILVLIPGIGIVRGGARSWIGIGDFSIQPAEFMKLASIIFTAKVLSIEDGIMNKNTNLYIYILIILLVFFLIMLQPDFGTGIVIFITILMMLFIGKMKISNIVIGSIILIIGFGLLIISAPYRLLRITSYLDPFSDPLGSGFQIIQSLFALSPSGMFGYGLFNSKQKFFYLPEPQTDFIFSIIVEELGLVGGVFVIILFFIIVFVSLKYSLKTTDSRARNMLFGISSMIANQVFINISVVIGLLPVTGITLPFLSYGGSSLCITMLLMGIVYNILKEIEKEKIENNDAI